MLFTAVRLGVTAPVADLDMSGLERSLMAGRGLDVKILES